MDDLIKYIPTAISFFSFLLAFIVYKFNFKKDSFSKLSLKPIKVKSINNNSEETTEMPVVDFRYVNDINDEHIHYKIINGNPIYRFGIANGYGDEKFKHEEYDWVLELHNKGSFPSKHITLKYDILIKRLKFGPSKDSMGIGFSLDSDISIPQEEYIEYIGADEVKRIFICTLNGEFPEARIIVNKLESSEMKLIKKPTLIDRYIHPYLNNTKGIDTKLFLEMSGTPEESIKIMFDKDMLKNNKFYYRSNETTF